MIFNHSLKYLTFHKITQLTLSLFVILLSACQEVKDKSSLEAVTLEELKLGNESTKQQLEWETVLKRGDKAAKNKDWKEAARFYNQALDVINDSRKTPQIPSTAQIDKIHRLASNAMLLAVHTGQSRSVQSCSTLMRGQVRGFKIKKHLIPIQFEYGSSDFSPRGKQAARQLAHCLQENEIRGVHLIGHTDERGPDEFNMKLSIERAKALKNYLESEGISALMGTSGRGEREPLKLDSPENYTKEEIYALNRRVEVMTQY
jgi:outer membrane protein OmpA-like peptidoglycan-associated protein